MFWNENEAFFPFYRLAIVNLNTVIFCSFHIWFLPEAVQLYRPHLPGLSSLPMVPGDSAAIMFRPIKAQAETGTSITESGTKILIRCSVQSLCGILLWSVVEELWQIPF